MDEGNVDGDREAILTNDNIMRLREIPEFKNFLREIDSRITACRKEADMIPSDRLTELQGRIRAYKQVIGIFEVDYVGSDDARSTE